MNEDPALRFWAEPCEETLGALLLDVQGRIHSLCTRVLNHPQDAEDATQEVLLKIVRGLGSVREPRAVGGWVYRVALNVALRRRAERTARTEHERQAGTISPQATAGPDVNGTVHEAMAHLDDAARELLIRHFFERQPLKELARERGCSEVAVWKRIDKAKDELRRSLAESGIALAPRILEAALQPAGTLLAPAVGLSGSVTGEITSLLGSSKAAGIGSWGGVAMVSAKGLTGAALAIACAAFFIVGIGGGWAAYRPAAQAQAPVQNASARPRGAPHSEPEEAGVRQPAATATPAAAPALSAIAGENVVPLLGRLEELMALIRKARAASRKNEREASTLDQQCSELWAELLPRIFKDPPTFYAFLKQQRKAEDYQWVIIHLLGVNDPKSPGSSVLPIGMVDGLVDLIATGTGQQKELLIGYLQGPNLTPDSGQAVTEALWKQLGVERDPTALGSYLNAFHMDLVPGGGGPARLAAHLDLLREIWQRSTAWSPREQTLEALAACGTPEGEALFLEKLREAVPGTDPFLTQYIPQILEARLRGADPPNPDSYREILGTALRSMTDERLFLRFAHTALSLRPSVALEVLSDPSVRSPSAEVSAALARTIELLKSGETRDGILRQTLEGTRR